MSTTPTPTPPPAPATPGTPPAGAPETSETPDPADTPDDTDEVEDGQDEGADDATRKARRDAASYRERLRTTESTLAATEALVIAAALQTAGLPDRLWAAATPDRADLVGDDGVIDPAKVTAAAQALVTEYGLRTPRPNPQQGNPPGNGGGPTGLAAAFQPRPR